MHVAAVDLLLTEDQHETEGNQVSDLMVTVKFTLCQRCAYGIINIININSSKFALRL